MQLFSSDATVFLKKKLTFFFTPENMKKTPSKVAHNQPKINFYSTAGLSKWPQKRIPVQAKAS